MKKMDSVSWSSTAAKGVEGAAIALAPIKGSWSKLKIGGIPVGDTLSDGNGHSFTATAGNTSVDVTGWLLDSLSILTVSDTNFKLTATTGGGKSASESVAVNPLAPTIVWDAAVSGVEGQAIKLGALSAQIGKLAADGMHNSMKSIVVSSIPAGDVLSDGHGHSFTATATKSSVDITKWTLDSLSISSNSAANFTLKVTATETDAEGNTSVATALEAVVVNPLAPSLSWAAAPAAGLEGTPIMLGAMAAQANKLAADSGNALQSLVVSGLPDGAVLSDGHGHSFTALAGNGSVDVAAWTLSSLSVTPAGGASFTLTAIATERDADGNTSSATASEAVSVIPATLTLTAGAPSATLVEAGSGVAGVDAAAAQLSIGGTAAGAVFDTTGWTDNGNGTFSKAGHYGVAVLDGNAHTLAYHLDNSLAATDGLAAGQQASDDFTVTVVQPGGSLTASAPVSFAVAGSNDTAVLSSADVALSETDVALSTGGSLSISDVDSPAQFVAQSNVAGAYGSFSIDTAGNWSWQANSAHDEFAAGQTYSDSFQVQSADGTLSSVTVNVAGSDDAPQAQALSGAIDASGSGPLLLAAAYTDPDSGDSHSFAVDTTGTLGLVVNNGDGTFSYDPNGQFANLPAGATATDSFAYTVTDAAGLSSTEIATVTINGTATGGGNPGPSPFTVIDPAQAASQAGAISTAILGNQPGLSVDLASLSMVAGSSSAGFYDGSLAALGIGPGLIITSGTMPGTSNTVGYFGQDNNMPGDPALDAVVNTVFSTTSFDATTIKFNFTVTDPTLTGITFDAVFGSDEFPEWVNQFVDIGVVLVNGVNVAYFGNDLMAPLSVIGSNLAANYFVDNTGNLDTPSFGGVAVPGVPSTLPIEYDGVSHVLKIAAPVHTGVNTIEIGIADTGDHIYDSGLIISNLAATSVPTSGVSLDVVGTSGNDDLVGTAANETIDGKAGDDVIAAGGGDDVVLGGAGNDQVDGGDGKDFLDGGSGVNQVAGGAGDDVIQHLESAGGVDHIDGGSGFNTLKLDLSVEALGESINLSNPAQPQALNDGSTFVNVEAIEFHGGSGNDVVTGGAAADLIDGGAGDDVLAGGGGNDQIMGGAGVDTAVFSGNAADYQLTDLGGGQWQVADLAAGSADGTDSLTGVEFVQFADQIVDLAGSAAGATIQGTGNDDIINATTTVPGQPLPTAYADTIDGGGGDDKIQAGDGNDLIKGGAGNDKLDGGNGDDVLVGGAGADELIGGAGADTFVFTALSDLPAASHDQIDDFNHAQGDKIDLHQMGAFHLAASFSQTAGDLIVVKTADGYLVQGDVDGDGAANFSLSVKSETTPIASDFLL